MPFDIRSEVAEVPREEDTVSFTFDIKLAKKVKDLRAAAELDEEAIAEAEAELKDKSYTAEIMSVPRRRREDLVTQALDAHPAKPSVFGHDEKAEYLRGNFVRLGVVIAAVKRIISPKGETQDTPEEIKDTITFIHDEAPDQVFETIERAVQKLNDEEDAQDALHKSADF